MRDHANGNSADADSNDVLSVDCHCLCDEERLVEIPCICGVRRGQLGADDVSKAEVIPPDQQELAERVAERPPVSLAHQILFQSNTLTMLQTLARNGQGGQVLELLLNPVKMAAAYDLEYGLRGGAKSD